MKTPEEIAREIVGPCEFPGVPCVFEGRHPSLCTRCGIAPGVAAAIREAEIRGVALGIAYCEKSLEASGQIIRFARSPESIVAARSAGTVPPAPKPGVIDLERMFSASDAMRTAPKPAPACARCGGSGYFCPVCSRSECFQGDPCPDCRGKP